MKHFTREEVSQLGQWEPLATVHQIHPKRTKRCTGCGEVKPVDQYTPDPSHAGGTTARCRPCRAEVARAWYWSHIPEERARKQRYRERQQQART